MPSLLFSLVAAYVLGALPFSLWAGRLLKGIDLRSYGSGNLGATNVLRVLGPKVAIPVLALDIGKGAAAALLAPRLRIGGGPPAALTLLVLELLCAAAAVAGHMWTPFAGFRGGKGVATAAGAFLAITPLATAAALLVFAVVLALSRFVSLGSIAAAFAFPWLVAAVEPGARRAPLLAAAIPVAALIIWRHRANIGRLVSGTESKLGRPAASRGDAGE